MVMTDWFGGKDAVAQMEAGNDMLQPGLDRQYEAIVNAVKEGKLDEAILNRNVERILNMILQTPHSKIQLFQQTRFAGSCQRYPPIGYRRYGFTEKRQSDFTIEFQHSESCIVWMYFV